MTPYNIFKRTAITSLVAAQLIPTGLAFAASDSYLIKASNNPAVYLVSGTVRHPFPLLGVYKSWYGSSFANITVVNPESLASYTLGKNVLFKPGSLIKIQTDPKVYRVADESGTLEWIQSEAEFLARGFSFKDVMDVPDTLFSDYTPSQSSDFATPPNGQNENGMGNDSTQENDQNQVPLPLAINSLSVTTQKTSAGAATATFTFSTSKLASITLDLLPLGGTTSTYTIDAQTSFSKAFPVQTGAAYTYRMTAIAPDGEKSISLGSFVAYADIHATGIPNLIKSGSPLALPQVLVGGFTLKNNSSEERTLTELTFQFDSESIVTKQIAKTIRIVRLNADNTIGETITERTIGSNVAITNSLNTQRVQLDQKIAPGETGRYGIVFTNFDQLNIDATSPSDTFVPRLIALQLLGDTSYSITNEMLGALSYTR